jgi:hypothetical protein
VIFKYFRTCKTKQNSKLNSNNKIENRNIKQNLKREKREGNSPVLDRAAHQANPAAAQ